MELQSNALHLISSTGCAPRMTQNQLNFHETWRRMGHGPRKNQFNVGAHLDKKSCAVAVEPAAFFPFSSSYGSTRVADGRTIP
ncbi:unnamed protein product [Pleuronectes platessa]|uniref:Uncharacterized protein n=1 Tax=Pleuronectes platessa TaxID=8262 RepID=A0A9N7TQL8_PLEPL|nr:unnamed protein product [Pleuronectes platessa]